MDNNEVDDNQIYWWSNKPAGIIILAALAVFPFILIYWVIVKIIKGVLFRLANRRHRRIFGDPMNWVEELNFRLYLDRKFMI